MIGSSVENFKILEVLGEGGMGIVYKAFDLKLERFVALKILGTQAGTNPRFIERFKREAKNQAKLSHPNIVTVYGFTEVSNTFGIAMEYIKGETLDDLVERLGKIELVTALRIIRQVLAGCSYSHNKGFIHRDIKPSNIIIGQDSVAKIMDFGISKSVNEGKGITKTGTKLGTILYMSPEQLRGQEPTRQSDIYSVGCTLYEMILGKPPFDYDSEFEIMEAHLKKEPIPLSEIMDNVPSAMDSILSKALNKSDQRRYHTCEEFLHDINHLIPKLEHSRNRMRLSKKLSKPLKLKYVVLPIIIILLLGSLLAVVLNQASFLWESDPPRTDSSSLNIVENKSEKRKEIKWKILKTPSSSNLNSVYFLSDSVGFVCGDNNTLLKTTDSGKNWFSLFDSTKTSLIDITFINSKTGFIIGDGGLLLKTNEAGSVWVKRTAEVSEQLTKIFFLPDGKTGFITTTKGRILKTDNAGETWLRLNTKVKNVIYSISFVDDEIGFAVGWNGLLMKTVDGGENWRVQPSFTDKYLKDISFKDRKNGLIVGGGGEIYRTSDGGNDWKLIPSGLISGLTAIPVFSEYISLILSSTGEILLSSDYGISWERTTSGSFAPLTKGFVTNNGDVYLATYKGTIIKSEKSIN